MVNLVIKRFIALIVVLFGLALIVFVLQAIVPSNPARAMVGASAPESVVAAKSHELGYDKPLPQRFADYVDRLLHGNLQESLRTRNPVSHDLATFAPATIELALVAAAIAAVLGLGLGLLMVSGGKLAHPMRVGLISGAS